jgi:type II secretory pathway component GspD/PulD (secretin)
MDSNKSGIAMNEHLTTEMRRWAIIVLGLAMTLAIDVQSSAETQNNDASLISNVFYETDLRQALQDVAMQAGVTIIAGADVHGYVTCELNEVPLEKALRIVLAGTGYAVKKTPDYYFASSVEPTSPSFPLISETRLVKLDNARANTALKLLSDIFQRYVEADPDANTICITAPQSLMERIVSDIKLIDKLPRHVMLDVRIVVMERGYLRNLGVQWDWPQAMMGTFTNSEAKDLYGDGGLELGDLVWPWGIEIGYTPGKTFTEALLLSLNLLSQNDEAIVIASPQVVAQDGKEAEISVNTEEYFQIITQAGYYSRSDLEKIEAGTILKITPSIGDNGQITMDISAEVSDVVARGENNLPVVTRRLAQSTLRVEDGGTAVVAGLKDHRAQLNHSGIPILRSIPLLGRLFGSDIRNSSSRQVDVFVTARLLPEGETGVHETRLERPRIPLVGKEFKQELRRSMMRMDRERQPK